MSESFSIEQCVILAGGLGTRLGDLTRLCPKPMLEVAGRPFMGYVLRQMAGFGFRRFLLLAGHRGEVIAEYFSRAHTESLTEDIVIETIVEPEPLGTAGALRLAAGHLDSHFLLCNGDSFFQCDVSRLLRPFQSEAAWGRLALTRAAGRSRFGTVLVEGAAIIGFQEKTELEGSGPEFMNMGLYMLSRDILQAVPTGKCSLETDIFPCLAKEGQLEAQVFEPGFFIDIGVPADFARAQTALPEAWVNLERWGTLS